jgi:hypothetical protein
MGEFDLIQSDTSDSLISINNSNTYVDVSIPVSVNPGNIEVTTTTTGTSSFFKNSYNGFYTENGINKICNAHISYKGRSIIVDYEHCLHCYPPEVLSDKTKVPCEMYPYEDDIVVFYAKMDKDHDSLVDIMDVILEANKCLASEDKSKLPEGKK